MEDSMIKKLKQMNYHEMEVLASDIRNQIIEAVSKNGGHLSSNLGIVELTIALHKVFNTPEDLLIFDVSHQTYAHKILTGRSLEKLRKIDGVSGFTRMNESIHDSYEAGHSSTSISALAGFLEAKKIKTENTVKILQKSVDKQNKVCYNIWVSEKWPISSDGRAHDF